MKVYSKKDTRFDPICIQLDSIKDAAWMLRVLDLTSCGHLGYINIHKAEEVRTQLKNILDKYVNPTGDM